MSKLIVFLFALFALASSVNAFSLRNVRRAVGAFGVASSVAFTGVAASVAAPADSIVVLGSNGKTGSAIVTILAEQGYKVQPTSYKIDGKKNKWEGVANVYEPIKADVTNPASLPQALRGAKAVIFAASASSKGGNAQKVDYEGVDNVAKASIAENVPRLVVISSGAVTRPDSLGFKITNLFGNIMTYKLQGEDALRGDYAAATAEGKKLSYAIIRPGGLVDSKGAGVSEIELNQGDTIAGEISRRDVAEVTAAAAVSSSIPNAVTFEVNEKGRSGPLQGEFAQKSGYERSGDSYEEMFKGLKSNFNKL